MMKFKVEIEIQILNDEILEAINSNREWDDLPDYNSIEEVPECEILEYLNDSNYIQTDVEYYGLDISKITIVKE